MPTQIKALPIKTIKHKNNLPTLQKIFELMGHCNGCFQRWCEKGIKRWGEKRRRNGKLGKVQILHHSSNPQYQKIPKHPPKDLQKATHSSLHPLSSKKLNFIDRIITSIIPHSHLFQNNLKKPITTKVILHSFSTP